MALVGDKFYQAQVYESALSAYSAALDIDAENISCLANRAACYLKQASSDTVVDPRPLLKSCVQDCEAAIKALHSTVLNEKTKVSH